MFLKEFANSRVAVQFQGEDLGYFAPDQKNYYAEIWERADAVFFESKALCYLAQKRGFSTETTHFIIPPTLDLSSYQPADIDDELEDERRPLRLLSLGQLTWHQGYEDAVASVHLLLAAGLDCEYRIVSEGPCEAEIQDAIQQQGLVKKVMITREEPLALRQESLQWADVLLHTAVAPCNCQPILDAQAMRLPVVCSDAGSLPELVADGQTGFVIPRRQPDLVAEKLIKLAKDRALRQQMGQAALAHRRHQPGQADYMAALEQIYRDIVAE